MARAAFDKVKLKRFVFSDRDSAMIDMVRNRFPYPNTEFYVGESQQLHMHGEFDVVTAIQVHHYLQPEQRRAAVSRCYEALKEEGIFITFENFAPHSTIGKELYLNRWRSYQLAQGKSESDCDKHKDRYGKVYFPITIEEHLEVMRGCGFKAVEILWLSYMQVGLLGIK